MDHQLREYMDLFTGTVKYSYVGQKPAWHKLGDVIGQDSGKSAEMAFDNMSFGVAKQQAYAIDPATGEFVPVDGWYFTQLIERGGTGGAYFAPVSDGYQVIQPRELMQLLDVSMNFETPETIGAIHGGRTIFVTYNMDPFDIKGDPHRMYFSIRDSFGGDGRLTGQVVPFRVVCANTVALTKSYVHVLALSHRGDMRAVLQDKLADLVRASRDDAPKVVGLFERLAAKSLTQKQADEILAELMPAEEREWKRESRDRRTIASRNMIAVLFDGAGQGMDMPFCRGTAFGLVNAAAEFFQHEVKNLANTHHQKDNGVAVAADSLFGDAAAKVAKLVEMVQVR